MANPQPLIALVTDDLLNERCHLSMTNEDPAYTTDALLDHDPETVAKSTTTTTTITIDLNLGFISAPVAVGVALINCNAATASISGGGATTTIVMPGLEYGYGDRLNGWVRLAGTTPDFTWDVTLTRPSGVVWIGRIVLVTALRPFNARYGLQLGTLRPGRNRINTRLGSTIISDPEIRQRTAKSVVRLAEDELMLRGLDAGSRGMLKPFLFIPDEGVNDAWWVRQAADDFAVTYPNLDETEIPLAFEELSMGPAQG